MQCSKYPDRQATGICSFSGKPYCAEELVEIEGKLVAKDNVGKLMAEVRENSKQIPSQPMVFMNAGGGGGGASSTAAGVVEPPQAYATLGLKSKLTAGILAILLGGFGVHKFYLGKPVQGILYLLFCWTFVPTIIALIEGIYYLVMNDQLWAFKYGGAVRMA